MPSWGAGGRTAPVVARAECPPYYVTFVGGDHVLVAGGGGSAKTGVSNRLCVYVVQLPCGGGDESAGRVELTPVHTVDTSPRPTMNAHLLHTGDGTALLAAGQDDQCALYWLAPSLHRADADAKSTSGGERHRVQPLLALEATLASRFRSDFDAKAAYQKCVSAAPRTDADSPPLLATGGADGCLRLWRADGDGAGEMLAQADGAHKGDIDSVSLSPCGTVLLSVGNGDHRVALWTVSTVDNTDKLRLEHAADSPPPLRIADTADAAVKFRPRFAQFTRLGVRNLVFLVSYMPVQRGGKEQCSHLALCAYDQRRKVTVTICDTVATNEVISCMCVSSSGSHCAVGTLQGSVAVFDTHTLRKVYEAPRTHSIFVTGVALAPDHFDAGSAVSQGASAALQCQHAAVCVSVSADQTVQMHCAPYATGGSYTASLCLMLMVMLFAYWTLKLIGV